MYRLDTWWGDSSWGGDGLGLTELGFGGQWMPQALFCHDGSGCVGSGCRCSLDSELCTGDSDQMFGRPLLRIVGMLDPYVDLMRIFCRVGPQHVLNLQSLTSCSGVCSAFCVTSTVFRCVGRRVRPGSRRVGGPDPRSDASGRHLVGLPGRTGATCAASSQPSGGESFHSLQRSAMGGKVVFRFPFFGRSDGRRRCEWL